MICGRSKHTDAVIFIKHLSVLWYVSIQCFQKYLPVRIKLQIQLFDNPFKNVLLVSKILQGFFWQFYSVHIKEFIQLGCMKLFRTFRKHTLMKSFEIIHIIFYRFLCIQFHIIWPIILYQCKTLINSLSPENLSFSIYFNDVLAVRVDTIFIIVINEEQYDGKNIKTPILTITIKHINNLLFGTAVALQNFNNLFHFIQNILIFLWQQIFWIHLYDTASTGDDSNISKYIQAVTTLSRFIGDFYIIIYKVRHFKLIIGILYALQYPICLEIFYKFFYSVFVKGKLTF